MSHGNERRKVLLFPRIYPETYEIIEEDEEGVETVTTVSNELATHLSYAISENSANDIDSEKASIGSKNIETIAKALSSLEKAEAEKQKVILQIEQARTEQAAQIWNVAPKVAGVVITGLVTIFWIMLERNSVVPMRLVQMTNSLITPRGL